MKNRKKFLSLFLLIILFLLIFINTFYPYLSDIFLYSYASFSGCLKMFEVEAEDGKNSNIYKCSEDELNLISKVSSGGGSKAVASYRSIVITRNDSLSGSLLMHELGHNMGYNHVSKKSIMNPKRAKREHHRRMITQKAKRISKNYKGFKHINWSNPSDVKYIGNEIKNNNISNAGEYIITKNYEEYVNRNCSGIYYTKEPYWSNIVFEKDFYAYCK